MVGGEDIALKKVEHPENELSYVVYNMLSGLTGFCSVCDFPSWCWYNRMSKTKTKAEDEVFVPHKISELAGQLGEGDSTYLGNTLFGKCHIAPVIQESLHKIWVFCV